MKNRILPGIVVFLVCLLLFLPAAAQTVTILQKDREERLYTEDGEHLLADCFYLSAIVRIDGNFHAETLINNDLRSLESQAVEEWQIFEDEITDYWRESFEKGKDWLPRYTNEMRKELTAVRIDDKVLSFKVQEYLYTGGAHGMYSITGVQYDTVTGNRLFLENLSDDPDALRETCVNEIIQQCQSVEGLWWYDDASLRPVIELIVDCGSWYLTDTDIVFHSMPYELGPYAVGAIEFSIPYDQLPGFKYR